MVDEAKLRTLRDLYRDAKGGEMQDAHFRKVAEKLFQGGDRRKWPFAGVATFLDAPYRPGVRSAAWLKLKTAEWVTVHAPKRIDARR